MSADTSLSQLPSVLAVEPFLFMLQGNQLTGFITPADMGTVPARTHYYLLLSELELLLARFVRSRFDQTDALSVLSDPRRVACEQLFRDLGAHDAALDRVATMNLVDLVKLVGTKPDFVAFAIQGGRSWRWLTGGLGDFRNEVMHPVRGSAHATQSGMRGLAKFDERLRALSGAARELLETPADETSEEGT